MQIYKSVQELRSFYLSKYEKYCIIEGGMILTLEEFIMENISWIDLTMAGITLISVIVAIFVLIRNENATRELLSKDHDALSKDHDRLSTTISEKHQNIQEQQMEIKQTVSFLKDNALMEQGKKDMLSQQMLDIKSTSDHISALVDLVHNTQIEIVHLQQLNNELNIKLQKYESIFGQMTDEKVREAEEEMEL